MPGTRYVLWIPSLEEEPTSYLDRLSDPVVALGPRLFAAMVEVAWHVWRRRVRKTPVSRRLTEG